MQQGEHKRKINSLSDLVPTDEQVVLILRLFLFYRRRVSGEEVLKILLPLPNNVPSSCQQYPTPTIPHVSKTPLFPSGIANLFR